jgi:hypothetical protein
MKLIRSYRLQFISENKLKYCKELSVAASIRSVRNKERNHGIVFDVCNGSSIDDVCAKHNVSKRVVAAVFNDAAEFAFMMANK